jgi:hypothetical protein
MLLVINLDERVNLPRHPAALRQPMVSGWLPLARALAINVYVVTSTVLDNDVLGLTGAILTCVFLAGFWYVFPLMRKAAR